VFAVWHHKTGTLAWVNCGHPRPLLVDRDGGVSELVDEGTYPLGMFRHQRSFRRTEFRVQPGQRILLYSDGIPERRDGAGELFGMERVAHTLRACANATTAGAVRALQHAVLEFSPRPLRDDATILLVDTDPTR
jgi:serine phosphatase RsbU (regulator of sigma subunit)